MVPSVPCFNVSACGIAAIAAPDPSASATARAITSGVTSARAESCTAT